MEHDSNLIVNCQEEAYGNYGDEKNLIEFRKEMIQRIKFVSFHKEEDAWMSFVKRCFIQKKQLDYISWFMGEISAQNRRDQRDAMHCS